MNTVYNIPTIKLPIEAYKKAITITREAISGIRASLDTISKWGTEEKTLKEHGERGIELRNKDIEESKTKISVIRSKALKDLENAKKEALDFIEAETTPNGEDIIGVNAGDFALLKSGLITSPEKLQRIIEKHDNVAFRLMASEYAKERKWDGFQYIETSAPKKMNDYIFKELDMALKDVNGIHAVQYTETKGEYHRTAQAFGLESEFVVSGGESIDELL